MHTSANKQDAAKSWRANWTERLHATRILEGHKTKASVPDTGDIHFRNP